VLVATTENITVLFTDLVGSTELASSLTLEAGDQVRRKHFSALRQAIATNGGTEVKNLGDGFMVVFPAASAAVACAVTMQQIVHRDNASAERSLGLRVGLSSGEASREADDYFGDPVIEAARLCAKAEGGQILASDLVRANAGRRSSHTFTSLGELELKGLPEHIETLQISWEPLRADAPGSGRAPLPTRLSHRPAVGVIGRENEFAALEAAAERVASGEGRELILLAGEPGQGKTTLVSELARHAHGGGMTVLFGRCDEEVGSPYRPFHEALSHLVAHADEALLRTHVGSHGGELARMVPALGQRLGELPPPQTTDPDTERYLLYTAVVGLLEEASQQRPVVLVLDDLHWADKPSLQLLRHVMANTSASRLLILGTYRDGELSAAHPFTEALAALHREPTGVSTIDLKGLEDTGVIAFMESAAGHELDDALVGLAHQLYGETDGNPFFVAEVLRNLSESGDIVQDATTGRWTAKDTEGRLSLPPSVRTVIGTRVSRLGEGATKVLSTAAVIGRDFDFDLLAETTKVDEDELIELLDDAERAAVVHELSDAPGRYTFSHALVQHTLYEDLGGTRRTRLHKSVGEAIERLYGENGDEQVGELARHFFLATRPADSDKAIAYAKRAGDAALEALAPDDAVRYFSQALELVVHTSSVDPLTRIDLLIGLGTAQRQAGIAAFRESLLEAASGAQVLGDTDRLVTATLANSREFVSVLGQLDAEKVDGLEAALDAIPDADSPERARLLATLCTELTHHSPLERRLALADEAKAIARRLGDRSTFVDVVNRCGPAVNAPSTLAMELADFEEALAAGRDLDDPVVPLLGSTMGCTLAIRSGQFELARERLATSRSMVEQFGQPLFLWIHSFADASLALLHGDTEEAEHLATVALEVGTAGGQPDALAFYGVQLIGTRDEQGRMGELLSLIADAAEQNPLIPTYRAVLAAAHLDAGDEDRARELVDEGAAASFALPDDYAWFDGMLNYARVVVELRLRAHSEPLIELLAPFRDQVPHNGLIPHPPVATFLGGLATVVDRFEEAESYFVQAADLNKRGEMKFAEAYTNMLWGRMLRTRNGPGDADRARQLLEQARESAAARGYAVVESQANAEFVKTILIPTDTGEDRPRFLR
jgi:class 3 adenylate cyclase/tetratricopeptide (TPR) repeat protein